MWILLLNISLGMCALSNKGWGICLGRLLVWGLFRLTQNKSAWTGSLNSHVAASFAGVGVVCLLHRDK